MEISGFGGIALDDFVGPMCLFHADSLRILDLNDAMPAQLGLARDELLGASFFDLHHPEDAERLHAAVASLQEEMVEAGLWRVKTGAGQWRPMDLRWRRVRRTQGNAVLVSIRDQSRLAGLQAERDLLRAGLRERDIHERAAGRLLDIGYWSMDQRSGALEWSSNVFKIYGVRPQTFKPNFEAYVGLVHPDDRQKVVDEYHRFSSSGETLFDFRHRIIRDDGEIVFVHGAAELRDENARLIGVVQDVTPSQQKQEQLNQALSMLRMAGRIAKFGGWRVDLDEGRVLWSAETARIHELPEDVEISLEQGINFYAPEHQERIRAVFEACTREGRAYDEVLQIITAKGKRLWVRAIGEAVSDQESGRITSVRGAFQDISDLVAARDQSEALSQRLMQTLDGLSDAFFTLDEAGRFTFLNREAERLFQRERREMLGAQLAKELPQSLASTFLEQLKRAHDQQQTVRFREHYAARGAWFDISAYPTCGGLAVYARDVTKEKAREEHLRLLEVAIARQNDMLIITEAQPIDEPAGPRIVFVNDAFIKQTGYAREDVIGKTPRFLQGSNTEKGELRRVREALEAWRPVRAEIINYTKEGQEFWLEMDITPIADDTGWFTHWVAIERDITERRRAEQALRVSEERFRLVASATNDVVWDWDILRGSVWWNENVNILFGFEAESGSHDLSAWTDHIHPEDRERVLTSLDAALFSSEVKWAEEYKFCRANGGVAVVSDRGFIIRDDAGAPVRMLGSMLDVTEQRSYETRLRRSQKMEAIGQLTGGVAHDFNNLLTVIMGNAEALLEHLKGSAHGALAEMTLSAAQKGAELTSRLLSFSRQQALEPRRLNFNELIAGMEPMLRRTLVETIHLETRLASALWAVEADPVQLETALLNLAINARDAMPNGGRLLIETANFHLDRDYIGGDDELAPGEYVAIIISDTGCGMTPDVLSRVFEPFFTTKSVGKGSGLGLPMVYGFVRQSGGLIRIYSEPESGTSVKLYFPRSDRSSERPMDHQTNAESLGGVGSILVVEDDALVRSHLTALLSGLGYEVLSADSGPSALRIIERRHEIDLLLTDVVMPEGMNGRQLADAALALNPKLKVLFSSGYSEEAIIHHGRLDPGVEFIGKPYRRAQLADKVRKILESRADKPFQ